MMRKEKICDKLHVIEESMRKFDNKFSKILQPAKGLSV